MEIKLYLSPRAAAALQQRAPPTSEARELLRAAEELAIELRPTHPGASDPLLVGDFSVEVDDRGRAERVVERLRELGAVESVYLKPAAEPAK